jgi:hypothetical protein
MDIAIEEALAGLGLTGEQAADARAELERAGLTNPRKRRISVAKLEDVRAAIDARFARLCDACAARGPADARERLRVPPASCVRCGGSNNDRALAGLVAACRGGGVERIVFVGGSPSFRRELQGLHPPPELRLVDGTARRTAAEAAKDLAWADLVVVCGGTELAHKVSTLYTRKGDRVLTTARRGIEAIADEVVRHLELRREAS